MSGHQFKMKPCKKCYGRGIYEYDNEDHFCDCEVGLEMEGRMEKKNKKGWGRSYGY